MQRKINTHYEYPPIPDRSWDWIATYDDLDYDEENHNPYGHGSTEQKAIEDLRSQEVYENQLSEMFGKNDLPQL